MKNQKGKVYLVGAGPGDIGLFTVKGMKCLQKADVVIYDFHLNAQVLNYINHDAEFIYAGKRGGHHTMTQDDINKALIEKAFEGKVVCRLKGGDPFVFGRGGEEAEALAKEGIEFSKIHKNIVVKIPMTQEGMKAVKMLSAKGIRSTFQTTVRPARSKKEAAMLCT